MSLNPATFLKRLEAVITGEGFKKVIPGLDINSLRLTTGAILAADSGNPMRASLETSFEGVQLASSQTSLGTLTSVVPEDYDESRDKLRIRFLANSAGDTNTPTIDAAIYRKRAATALSADLNPTISGAVNNNTAKAGWVEINADGLGLQAGDAITVVLTSSAHTTDALNVYGLEVVYAACLVYFDPTDRSFS